jgi:hypothetical protein
MAQLSEIAQRALSELEEAGEENIPTLLNTVTERTGAPGELLAVQDALRSLINAGFAAMAVERDVKSRRWKRMNERESLALIDRSPDWLSFRASDCHWTDRRMKGPPFTFESPHVLATAEGYARGRKILDERGYQWWRHDK